MITLHFLKLLENAGFGTIGTDLYYQKAPVVNGQEREGMWIVDRPSATTRRNIKVQQFDIYSRYTDPVDGSKKLQAILDYLEQTKAKPCTLPTVPNYSSIQYVNVRVTPLTSLENVGVDSTGKIVRVISGELRYNKSN